MGGGKDGKLHITDRNGNPNVFNLEHNDNGLWLNNNWTNPTNKWNLDNELMFRLRKYFFTAPCCDTNRLQGAVFLFRIIQIFLPTAKHSTGFSELLGYFFEFVVGNDFTFPSDRDQKFQRI